MRWAALFLAMAGMLNAQTSYKVKTLIQYDEGFGLRISNGTDSGTGLGGLNIFRDAAKAWTTNAWAGGWLTDSTGVLFQVTSNLGTELVVSGTPADGAYTLRGGWRGWNILGVTDLPYDMVDEYPADTEDNAVQRLVLDLQDANAIYPRIMAGQGETGRIIRMQIRNGAVDMDLTGLTLTVKTYKQSDDSVVRNYENITPYISDTNSGWIEWLLDGTKDTAQSFYFTLRLTASGVQYDLPTNGYIYVDAADKAASSYTSGTVASTITIKAGGWTGKNVKFQFYDWEGKTVDVSPNTVGMNYAVKLSGPTFFSSSSCAYDGTCTWAISAAKYASANIYPIFWKLTSPSGEYIYVPADGHVILEAK